MNFTDQLNRRIEINFPSKRIISLVPSQTELLFDLGLKEEVIGITKFCVHPEKWFRKKARVGGTKKLNLEKIFELNPDLIIGNKEENEKMQVEELMKKFPVWMSDIKNLEDALKMIVSIGEITGKENKAEQISNEVKQRFEKLKSEADSYRLESRKSEVKKTIYLIWKNPLIAVGKNTFIDAMMMKCGVENILTREIRYPEISIEELKKINPEIILLSSEPYPFREKHIPEFQGICPNAKIILVDGEMFSWYGSRLLKSPEYFSNLQKTLNINNKVF